MFYNAFSKNSHCDIDLNSIMLKRKLVRGIAIPNTYVKLNRNCIINEVARAMTKGEHTNERTYVHTHIHTYGTDPISPPQLCCARG